MKKLVSAALLVAGLFASNAAKAESVHGYIRGVNVESAVMIVMPHTSPRWLALVVHTRLWPNQVYHVTGNLNENGRGFLTFRDRAGHFEFSVESKK